MLYFLHSLYSRADTYDGYAGGLKPHTLMARKRNLPEYSYVHCRHVWINLHLDPAIMKTTYTHTIILPLYAWRHISEGLVTFPIPY